MTLTAHMAAASASGISSLRASRTTPAQFTRAVRAPSVAAAATYRPTLASSVTSGGKPTRAPPPTPSTWGRAVTSTSPAATIRPETASRRQIARPMPPVPPVTSATAVTQASRLALTMRPNFGLNLSPFDHAGKDPHVCGVTGNPGRRVLDGDRAMSRPAGAVVGHRSMSGAASSPAQAAIERVAHVPVYGLVVDKLRRAIHNGSFVPGDKFPPERELSKQLGVSRASVREAIRVLEGEGYVETRRGA